MVKPDHGQVLLLSNKNTTGTFEEVTVVNICFGKANISGFYWNTICGSIHSKLLLQWPFVSSDPWGRIWWPIIPVCSGLSQNFNIESSVSREKSLSFRDMRRVDTHRKKIDLYLFFSLHFHIHSIYKSFICLFIFCLQVYLKCAYFSTSTSTTVSKLL